VLLDGRRAEVQNHAKGEIRVADIPGKRSTRLWERKWLVELIAVVPAVIAAAFAAYNATLKPDTEALAPILWLGIGWLVVASLLKVLHAYSQDRDAKAQSEHGDLLSALNVLVASILAEAGGTEAADNTVRATIHRVVPPLDKPSQYEQITPYVGGKGGEAFRLFSINTGIVGKVARTGEAFALARQSSDFNAYVQELTRDWGYTPAEAKQLTSDTMSSMAVPVYSKERQVRAVVYIDSTRKNLFTTDEQKAVVAVGVKGIAAYFERRYQ
jgi:hypothetical protein